MEHVGHRGYHVADPCVVGNGSDAYITFAQTEGQHQRTHGAADGIKQTQPARRLRGPRGRRGAQSADSCGPAGRGPKVGTVALAPDSVELGV